MEPGGEGQEWDPSSDIPGGKRSGTSGFLVPLYRRDTVLVLHMKQECLMVITQIRASNNEAINGENACI